MNETKSRLCVHCSKELPEVGDFCPHCEKSQKQLDEKHTETATNTQGSIGEPPSQKILAFKDSQILEVFKLIIPKELYEEASILIGKKDDEKINSIFETKIQPLIDKYMDKIQSGSIDGEEYQWYHIVTKGIFHKENVETWIISNLRIIKLYHPTKERPKEKLLPIGLHICGTVIMNQHHEPTGNRIGAFTGWARRGTFGGVTVSTSKDTSITHGDLVFFIGEKEVLRFSNITDPLGVQQMIETMKKQPITV